MIRASCYRSARMGFCSQRYGRLGSTTQLAGSCLALLCLFFGIVFTAYVPSSLEQRIGSLFVFGLIPAVGIYAAGHVLGYLLTLATSLCAWIAAGCVCCLLISARKFVCWVKQVASGLSIRRQIMV